MPVEFLRTQFTFRMRSRSVHVSGISDGVMMDVIIPRPVLEHLGGAQRLNQDESFTVVVQNLELLRTAAAMAAGRRGVEYGPAASLSGHGLELGQAACAQLRPTSE